METHSNNKIELENVDFHLPKVKWGLTSGTPKVGARGGEASQRRPGGAGPLRGLPPSRSHLLGPAGFYSTSAVFSSLRNRSYPVGPGAVVSWLAGVGGAFYLYEHFWKGNPFYL